jgi:5-hydroxyisourate hydrolase
MSAITTHILDTSRGRPASGVVAVLEIRSGAEYRELGRGATDEDGRLRTLLPAGEPLARGIYRLVFHTGAYFAAQAVECFYPEVTITFEVRAPEQHYHVPLLLNPYGFSTYRGS